MKARFITASMIAIFLCAVNYTDAQVNSDYDKTVDFSKYKTFTFKGWEKNSDQQLNDLDKNRILDAFKSEFDSRGLKADNDNPDMAVTLFIVLDDKTNTTAYTNYTGGMGYGAGWGYGAGMGSSTTSVSTYDYVEGTLVIDFYDEETKKLIWQGTLEDTVNEKPKKREKSIPKNVAKLMKNYPVKPLK